MKKYSCLILLSLAAVTACNDNTGNDTENNQLTEIDNTSSEVLVNNTEEDSLEQMDKPLNNNSKSSKAITINKPLDEYKYSYKYREDESKLDSYPWLTSFFIAQSGRDFSDEEVLNLLSVEYYNEQDRFRKKELEKELLPVLNEEIDSYKSKIYYVKAPILGIPQSYNTPQEADLSVQLKSEVVDKLNEENTKLDYENDIVIGPTLQPYNFESKAFPLFFCDFSWKIFNSQGIAVSGANPNGYICQDEIKVEDQETARKIEKLINENRIISIGTAYYTVGPDTVAENSTLSAKLVFAEVDFIDRITDEKVAKKEFDFR